MKVAIWSNLGRDLPGWADAAAMIGHAGHQIVDRGSDDLSEAAAAAVLADADAIVVGLNPVTRAMLEAARHARIVAKPGIGVDNVDVVAATELGIGVCNTPGSNAEAVADHTIGLALAVLRNLVRLDGQTRAGRGWEGWPFVGRQLSGKVLGAIGTGNIGRAVVGRAVRGFGMQALAFDKRPNRELEREYGARYAPLGEVLTASDVVTVHVPLLPSTRGLIGRREIGLMTPSAILVNTARGGVVDEAALAEALAQGRLSGAGIDVFEPEPPTSSPLFSAPNTVLTPHVAGYSPEASVRSRLMTAENVVAALAGRPRHLVDPRVLEVAASRL